MQIDLVAEITLQRTYEPRRFPIDDGSPGLREGRSRLGDIGSSYGGSIAFGSWRIGKVNCPPGHHVDARSLPSQVLASSSVADPDQDRTAT
jgi:hypothetical protein